MARERITATREPTREHLELLCEVAQALVWHIRRYWSIDGKPLHTPRLTAWGNSDGMRRTADLLAAVESGRKGKYPGPVIEWQLREWVIEWQSLNAGRLVYFPNVHVPWLSNPPAELIERSIIPPDLWQGWGEHVPQALREVVIAAVKIINPISRDVVPASFVGADLDALDAAAKGLRHAIAFVPSAMQDLILAALDGCAMYGEQLLETLNTGSKETLYGKGGRGGLSELVEIGLVKNDRKIGGYFRPDALPEK